MEVQEMTPKQRREAERLSDKVRKLEAVDRELRDLRRSNTETYEKLRVHEQYLSLMVKLTDRGGDKCCAEQRDYLWDLRKEAEADLYDFMKKPATFDDIEDAWNETSGEKGNETQENSHG